MRLASLAIRRSMPRGRPTTSASTIDAAVRVHDHRIQIDLARAARRAPATSAEKRAGDLAECVHRERPPMARGSRAGARCADASEQAARLVRRRRAAARRQRRRSASTCTPPAPMHDHRAELRVVDHAEQHLDALRLDHRRDERARADARRQDRARRRRAPRRRARSSRTPSRSDLWSMPRTAVLSTTGYPSSRAAAARARFALDDAARIRRQTEVAQQLQRLVLVEAACRRRAARASVREQPRRRRRAARRARARQVVAIIEQAAHAAQERRDAIEHREPFARRGDDLRVGARALAIGDQQRRLAGGARGRRAGSRGSCRGCRRRRRDRGPPRRARRPDPPSAWRSIAACRHGSRVRPCSTHRAD